MTLTTVELREQLHRLYRQHGRLTPSLVVAAARPADSPLHAAVFDRGPVEAAEAYYHDRARELIRSCRVTYRQATETEEARTVREFHSIPSDEGRAYHPNEAITANPFNARLLLMEMEREWKALRRKYGEYVEFLEMVRSDIAAGE